MSWFRKKSNPLDPDEVFDLDTIVWRGLNQMDRLDRLADAASRAEDHHRGNPDASPLYEPSRSLPDDLFSDRPVIVDEPAETPPADLSPIEAEAAAPPSEQASGEERIGHAVNAVLQSDTVAASIRAEIEQGEAPPSSDPALAPATPVPFPEFDISQAVKSVVRDEIGTWLQHNMDQIVADSFSKMAFEKMLIDARQQALKSQQPKTRPKAPKRKAGKAGRASGIGGAAKPNIVTMKARDQ